jgi:hypothetical protein
MTQETEVKRVTTVSQSTSTPPIQTEPPQKVYQTKKTIFRTYQVIWYILGVVEVLLAFRIILKVLGANAFSGFASLIYTVSDPLALPFYGIFRIGVIEGSVFEWSTILAGIVYLIVAYGIIEFMQFLKPTTPQEVETSV